MSVYRRRDGVCLVGIEGAYLLACTRKAREDCRYVSQVNELGAFIWEHMDGEDGAASAESLAKAVVREYEVDEAAALQDVSRFLEALCERGLMIRMEEK